MPSRNILRVDIPDSYYHVYVRGVNRLDIFRDGADKEYFLYLLSRHLSNEQVTTKTGYTYPHYKNQVELLAFCIMDNHMHLLIYQAKRGGIQKLLKSILTSYTTYYNRKHTRSGPLYESRYRSSLINDDVYLLHISRYIHLNPRRWKRYKYSSVGYFIGNRESEWLKTEKVLQLHKDRDEYKEFLEEYEHRRDELAKAKKAMRKELEP